MKGTILSSSGPYSTSEIVAFTGLDERRVRKDFEHGLFGAANPPRFELAAFVYFEAIQALGFDIGVEDRKRLYALIRNALNTPVVPMRVRFGDFVELRIGRLARDVKARLRRFDAWKKQLVVDSAILGGEPVFPNSRLAVRRVGDMLLAGVLETEIVDDYPYLKSEDIEFAKVYSRAYPRLGRPREAASRRKRIAKGRARTAR